MGVNGVFQLTLPGGLQGRQGKALWGAPGHRAANSQVPWAARAVITTALLWRKSKRPRLKSPRLPCPQLESRNAVSPASDGGHGEQTAGVEFPVKGSSLADVAEGSSFS